MWRDSVRLGYVYGALASCHNLVGKVGELWGPGVLGVVTALYPTHLTLHSKKLHGAAGTMLLYTVNPAARPPAPCPARHPARRPARGQVPRHVPRDVLPTFPATLCRTSRAARAQLGAGAPACPRAATQPIPARPGPGTLQVAEHPPERRRRAKEPIILISTSAWVSIMTSTMMLTVKDQKRPKKTFLRLPLVSLMLKF